MTLDDYDVKAGDTVYIQDMGTQVSYRLVILKHYLFHYSRKFLSILDQSLLSLYSISIGMRFMNSALSIWLMSVKTMSFHLLRF